MRKLALVLFVLLTAAWITAGCDSCEEDHEMFWNCYYNCMPDDQACLNVCINTWYCADWYGFCDFYDPFCDPIVW